MVGFDGCVCVLMFAYMVYFLVGVVLVRACLGGLLA